MSTTASMWGASEQSRPSKLHRASAAIGADWERRDQRCAQRWEELEDWQQRDWDRWQSRQRVYADELRRILAGHPERIESRAVIMFY